MEIINYRNKKSQNTFQTKIGILFGSGGVSISILILLSAILRGEIYSNLFNSLFIFIVSIFFFISARYKFKFFKWFQFLFLFGFSIATIISESLSRYSLSMIGYTLFITSIVVYLKYNLNNQRRDDTNNLPTLYRFGWVLVILIIFNSVMCYTGVIILVHIVTRVVVYIFTMILLYNFFNSTMIYWINENRKLQKEISENSNFVKIGKNYSMLAHNLRGKLSIIQGLADIILMDFDVKKKSKDVPKYAKGIIQKVEESINYISTLIVYTKMGKIESEVLEIKTFLNSIVTVADLYFNDKKKIVKCYLNSTDEEFIKKVNVVEFQSIFENLLMNSVEAREDYALVEIDIKIYRDREKNILIEYEDNCNGISWCKECKIRFINRDCKACEKFKIGKTTKNKGSGIGMTSVQEIIDKNNWDLKILSHQDGTMFRINLGKN